MQKQLTEHSNLHGYRTGKKKFVAFTHGFHGRTVGSLAVTHKPAIREPFEPLGMIKTFVEYGDLDALKKVVDEDTAGVIFEPIQGEAGVVIPPDSFIKGIREICDDTGALMIADEVQTGMGRTGKWLAMQHTNVKPDIVTLAKGIASGFPMGALVAREDLEFKKSEHGSTFAGGPLACSAVSCNNRCYRKDSSRCEQGKESGSGRDWVPTIPGSVG